MAEAYPAGGMAGQGGIPGTLCLSGPAAVDLILPQAMSCYKNVLPGAAHMTLYFLGIRKADGGIKPNILITSREQ